MLIRGTELLHTPILSLQTGSELAQSSDYVIDPASLAVLAFTLEGPRLTEDPSLLRVQDIREISSLGFIVDSSDEFISKGFVIKIHKIMDTGFNPYNMRVLDTEKQYVGRISDLVIDTNTFLIEQLVVKQPILRRINTTEIVIGRKQIRKISNDYIIVESPTVKEESSALINPLKILTAPFRKSESPKPVTSPKEMS